MVTESQPKRKTPVEKDPSSIRRQKTRMTRSAQNDPEVKELLEELEKLGYPFHLPERWGAKRAKKMLKLIISAVTPGICPVCGRKLE